MNLKQLRPIALLAIVVLLTGLACNLTNTVSSTNTPEPEAEPTQESQPTEEAQVEPTKEEPAEPSASGAIDNREDVEKAVVRIEARGDFVEPEGDAGIIYEQIGSGTGFIIDSSGLTLTNNHVVTGADTLSVYFSQNDEPFNARVVARSECSDLALIDIEGDDFPYLDWYEGELKVGMQVWSAGYPLGDPEYSLHRGVISKRSAKLSTDWTSVDAVIEHDATINPGNSGGPLLDDDGKVVAVNYASSGEAVNQFYAIARQEVFKLLDDMKAGNDVTSIGVNGTALLSEDGSLSGIWVYSVDTGSPAYQAGIRGGDFITQLEGTTLAQDGTLADYCKILRSHAADDPLAVQVWRLSTDEVLEGVLNGDELEATGSLGLSSGGTDDGGTTTGGGAAAVYDDFEDDYGNFEVFDGAQVSGGELYLGKFEDCADTGSGNAYGCFATCLSCGEASTYNMQLDAIYVDGVSDRTFGMVLRFVDNNGNAVVDSGDYYLSLSVSVYDRYVVVWEYGDSGWNQVVSDFSDAVAAGTKWNTLRAETGADSTEIDLYINGNYLTTISDIPYTSGMVGVAVEGRAMRAAFDNFIFEPK